jgi:hypothetical protein
MTDPGAPNPQVTVQQEYGDTLLRCPRCGDDYLHHTRVEVFDREEDAAVGLHTTAGAEDVRVDRDLSQNPSSRRDGIAIAFYCEMCDGNSDGPGPGVVLTIAQHKGRTFLAWRKAP